MVVRTARLATGTSGAAGANVPVYTCPPGVTTIIKDIRLARNLAGAQPVNVGVKSGPPTIWLINNPSPTGDVVAIQPWTVLEPGDQITVLTQQTGAWSYYISGTELDGVAP